MGQQDRRAHLLGKGVGVGPRGDRGPTCLVKRDRGPPPGGGGQDDKIRSGEA